VIMAEIITMLEEPPADLAVRREHGAIAGVAEVAERVAIAFLGQVELLFIVTHRLLAGTMGAGMEPAVAVHQADVVFSPTLKAVRME